MIRDQCRTALLNDHLDAFLQSGVGFLGEGGLSSPAAGRRKQPFRPFGTIQDAFSKFRAGGWSSLGSSVAGGGGRTRLQIPMSR